MKIKLTEQNIWWMVLGIIIGVISLPLSQGNYGLTVLHLGYFATVIVLWRFIVWIILKTGIIKKPCS